MIATMTGGIAHGISASVRASHRNRRFSLSSRASPSASDELQDGHRHRPDQADPERVQEQAVVPQLAVVVRTR